MPVPTTPDVRPEVLAVLRQLRSRIRRYVLLEGTASILAVLGMAFWLSLSMDYGLELPRVVRAAMLFGAASLFACTFVLWVLLRFFREFKTRALALVLERRFPDLNDRLITAIELAGTNPAETALTASMLRRAGDEVAELAGRLRLSDVFNIRPLLRSMLSALCLVMSIVAFGVAFGDVFGLWYRRNVLLANEYWPRETDLKISVLADPGERVREFVDGVYKHPRGSNLTLLAQVPEGKKVPEQVQFSYSLVNRSGAGRDYMTKIGTQQFRHTIAGLHDNLQLTLRGGDYSTRAPLRVEVVDPPRIDRMVLASLYPAYTEKNDRDDKTGQRVRDDVPVQGTQASLPAGTDFRLQAGVNKPLVGLRILTETFELAVTPSSATIKLFGAAAQGAGSGEMPLPMDRPFLAADGLSFSIPFLISTQPAPDFLSAQGQVQLPLRLPPDSMLLISLHDADDVISGEPARLAINSIVDQPPHIETQLKGIGPSITRQAVIPVTGLITDDYGVAEARFDFKFDADEAFKPRPFAARTDKQKKIELAERFEVLPLDLAIGRKLTLTVSAADDDNLTGPHRAQGEKYAFQIVSNSELLALIAVRELNLRRRFEQILEELKGVKKDLLLHRTRLQEGRQLQAKPVEKDKEADLAEQLANIGNAVTTSVDRAIQGTRKNANETVSIEESFRDIGAELENNNLPDVKPTLDRINDGIVRPLHSINTIDYNEIDECLARLKQALEKSETEQSSPDKNNDPFARLDNCNEQLDVTIQHMEAVLAQMLKQETFNEVLQLLRDIIKNQEEVKEKTKAANKKKLIEDLK